MCSQLALLKNDLELALLYSEIVPCPSRFNNCDASDRCFSSISSASDVFFSARRTISCPLPQTAWIQSNGPSDQRTEVMCTSVNKLVLAKVGFRLASLAT